MPVGQKPLADEPALAPAACVAALAGAAAPGAEAPSARAAAAASAQTAPAYPSRPSESSSPSLRDVASTSLVCFLSPRSAPSRTTALLATWIEERASLVT